MKIETAKELEVYNVGFRLAMEIFQLTKTFASEEKYALTSQIRRSSRSVCLNLREAWAKRRYEAHFISKLTDCDGENNETDSSLDFALSCGYITADRQAHLSEHCAEIGRMMQKAVHFVYPTIRLPISVLCPPTSDLRPQTSDL